MLSLTVILHKRDDHGSRVGQVLAFVHLPTFVLGLGEVDLQLVLEGLLVHLGQVGHEDAVGAHGGVDLQDRATLKRLRGDRRAWPPALHHLHHAGQHQLHGSALHGDAAVFNQGHVMRLHVQNVLGHCEHSRGSTDLSFIDNFLNKLKFLQPF